MGIFNFLNKQSNSFFDSLKDGAEKRVIEEARIKFDKSTLEEVASLIDEAHTAEIDKTKINILEEDFNKYKNGEIEYFDLSRAMKKLRDEIKFKRVLIHHQKFGNK